MARYASSFLLTLFAAVAVTAGSPVTGRADQPEVTPRESSTEAAENTQPADRSQASVERASDASDEAVREAAAEAAAAEEDARAAESAAEAAADANDEAAAQTDAAASEAVAQAEAQAEAEAENAARKEAARKRAECAKYTGSRLKPKACK